MARSVKAKAADMKKPRTLPKPRKAGADELSVISGIGPKIQDQLNEFGIYHYDQIANWKKPECNWVNGHLKFKGRIEREEWENRQRLWQNLQKNRLQKPGLPSQLLRQKPKKI